MPLSEGSGFRALAIEQGPPVATPVSGYGVPLVQCAREVSDREPLSPPLQPVDQAGDSNPAAARRVSRRDGGVRVRVDGEAARLDFEERKLPGLVRASVHYYNSEDEIERFCAALDETEFP